jgi:DNA polymerase-3 subunit alpha
MTNTATATEVGFVHLHVHSSYSLLEGATMVATIAKMAAADGQPALALTDTNNLFGALEFSEKLAGAGCSRSRACSSRSISPTRPRAPARPKHRSAAYRPARHERAGYGNLMKLVTEACLASAGGWAAAPRSRICLSSRWLIALTGGHGGRSIMSPCRGADSFRRQGAPGAPAGDLRRSALCRTPAAWRETARRRSRRICSSSPTMPICPIVATNEPFFAKPDDMRRMTRCWRSPMGRLVSDGERRRVTAQHISTRAEMKRRFADLPRGPDGTVEIAMRCSWRVGLRKPILPRFGGRWGATRPRSSSQAEVGLAARSPSRPSRWLLGTRTYRERLELRALRHRPG